MEAPKRTGTKEPRKSERGGKYLLAFFVFYGKIRLG